VNYRFNFSSLINLISPCSFEYSHWHQLDKHEQDFVADCMHVYARYIKNAKAGFFRHFSTEASVQKKSVVNV